MVKHPWPLLEISLSDFRGLATLNINTYLPTFEMEEGDYTSNAAGDQKTYLTQSF